MSVFDSVVKQVSFVTASLGQKVTTSSLSVVPASDYVASVVNALSTDPAPTGTDVVNFAGTALVAGDFIIRDADDHWMIRPNKGASIVSIGVRVLAGFATHTPTVILYGMNSTDAIIAQLTPAIPLSNTNPFTFGNLPPAVGAVHGVAAAPAAFAYYYVPNITAFQYVAAVFQAPGIPTDGTIKFVSFYRGGR